MTWHPIETAPRGRYVRIKCDDGSTKGPMRFDLPHWWTAPAGQLRVADASRYDGDEYLKATHWSDDDENSDRP